MIRRAVRQDAEAIFRVRMAAIRELAAGHYSEEQIRAWHGNKSPNSYEPPNADKLVLRSEEHTSELQSHHDLVCRLLLEKKKKKKNTKTNKQTNNKSNK